MSCDTCIELKLIWNGVAAYYVIQNFSFVPAVIIADWTLVGGIAVANSYDGSVNNYSFEPEMDVFAVFHAIFGFQNNQ